MNELARRRKIERHCSATLRALSLDPSAEFRNTKLYIQGRLIRFLVPHVQMDARIDSIDRCRGVTDATALRIRYSDSEAHRDQMPDEIVAKVVFDILEQLRIEAIASKAMPGLESNINKSFKDWCRKSRAEGLIENELGLMIYSITQIVRSRLVKPIEDEEVEGIIESMRFQLAPLIGVDLAGLKNNISNQISYAVFALNIANTLSRLACDAGIELLEKHFASLRDQNLLPPMTEQDDRYVESEDGSETRTGTDEICENQYHVFSHENDRQKSGDELYRKEQREELRKQLDHMISAQAVSVTRLAMRLQKIFALHQKSGWHDGEEEGYIDGRRLGQVVSRPGYSRIFKQEKLAPYCDTVVTFLIDNSGSMKRQRYESVAIMVDIYCRALDLAGVTTEVLGFTTGGWTGGESIKLWRKSGCPENPGRLNDRLHIVYKDAETSWRRSRYSISSMLNPTHFREGLDGEALEWACARLQGRTESRKCLVMISDGAPMDTATSNTNPPYFLENHLKHVISDIQNRSNIELSAIGIGLDMDEFFMNSLNLDLTGTLGNQEFSALEMLFPPA